MVVTFCSAIGSTVYHNSQYGKGTFIIWVVPLFFPENVANVVMLVFWGILSIRVPFIKVWFTEIPYVEGSTNSTVLTCVFHVGVGDGGAVGLVVKLGDDDTMTATPPFVELFELFGKTAVVG